MILTEEQLYKIRREFKFSPRELDVIKAIFAGIVKDEDISKEMKIDIRTTKQHLRNIYFKTRSGKKILALLKCYEIMQLKSD